jgi:hypothetical protein
MFKLFPDVETMVLSACLFLIFLWGVSRCNDKKQELAAKDLVQISKEKAGTISTRVIDTPITVVQTPRGTVATTVLTPSQPVTPRPLPRTPADVIAPAAPQLTTQYVTVPVQTVPAVPPTAAPANGLTPTGAVSAVPVQVPPVVVTIPAAPMLYVTIENLNLRTHPNVSGKLLGRLHLHEPVSFLNEVTQTTQQVTLANGEVTNEPWIKIKTQKGVTGWVYGAGVSFYKKKR